MQGFLSEDAKNIVDCVGKIGNKDCSQTDKTGALLNLVSNPTVMSVVDKIFSKSPPDTAQQNAQTTPSNSQNDLSANAQNSATNAFVNDELYAFSTPSQLSTQFFAPINGIADNEVKNKLYTAFDNWYVK